MDKFEDVLLGLVAGSIAGGGVVGLASYLSGIVNEPPEHKSVRAKIHVWSSSWGGGYLEWYPVRGVYGPDTDQFSVTYFLIFPGRGYKGDIDAIVEIYNPEGTWTRRSFSEMIVEFTRFSWGKIKVETPSPPWTWEFPEVTSDDVPSIGYMTTRVSLQ